MSLVPFFFPELALTEMQNQSDMGWNRSLNKFSPLLKADLIESESEYKVSADLPGVNAEDVEISVDHNCLLLKAERKQSHDNKTDKIHTIERSYGMVQRRIQLPRNADMDQAVTNFKNGVLTVTFPKVARLSATRKLEIKQDK